MPAEPDHKAPPYASYKSFQNFLDHLKTNPPLPSRIDRSAMHSANYGTQQALMSALRYLALVKDNDAPSLRLEKLIHATGKDRTTLLQEIARETYPYFFTGSADLTRITADQFDERIKSEGKVNGSTADKVGAFFIALANEAGIPLSPHLTKRRSSSGAPAKRARAKSRRNGKSEEEVSEEQHSETPLQNNQAIVYRLVDMLNLSDMKDEEQRAVWTLIQYLKRTSQNQ